MDISKNVKKLILAGIGAASMATEKAQETIEQLAQKGEEAVNQGKVLNERLRYEVKEAVKERVSAEEAKPADMQSVLAAIDKLNAQERAEILAKLSQPDGEENADGQ